MTIIRNIVAYLCAPWCLEVEAFNSLFLRPKDEQGGPVQIEMPQRYRYRFFSEDDAYAFVENWTGPNMIFRVYRRPLFTDKA